MRGRHRACWRLKLPEDFRTVLVRLWRWPAHRARGTGQADIDAWLQHRAIPGIVHLKHHLRGAGMEMFEPLCTGATDGTLTASPSHEVFPVLGRAHLEQFTRPTQVFSVQLRVTHEAVNVGQPLLVPGGNTGCLDKVTEVLIARTAKLHPTTVGTLEHTVPDATGRGDNVGWIVDPQGARADGRKGTIEQRHFERLPTPVAL